MASPITWRTINTPNFSSSNQLLSSAADRISKGLTGAQDLLDQRVEDQQESWNTGKENNTSDVVARIMGANTLGQHKTLSEELSPTGLKDTYGNQIDSVKVLQALNQRDNTIRADITAQNEFDDDALARSERDLIAQAQLAYKNGNKAEGDGIAANLSDGAQIKLAEYFEQDKDGKADRAWQGYTRNFQKGQNARTLGNQNSQDTVNSIVTKALSDKDMTEAEMRKYVIDESTKAGVSHEFLQTGLQAVSNGYRSQFETLSAADQRELSANITELEENYAYSRSATEKASQALQTEIDNIPKFAQIGGPKLSLGDLNNKILKDYKIETGSGSLGGRESGQSTFAAKMKEVVSAVKRHMQVTKTVGKADPVKIALEAVARTQLSSTSEDGGRLNGKKVEDAIYSVLSDFNTYDKTRQKNQTQIKTYNGYLSNLDATKRKEVRNLEKSYLDRQKLRKSIK